MSCTIFRLNSHSIFAWMSRNSLLETGAIWSLSDCNGTRTHNNLVGKRIESQFAYCPLIRMFCSKADKQRVDKYKSLQIVYKNYMATYDDKLKIHQRHLQSLAIEIYKFKNKLNPSFIWKTYKEKNIPYSLRRGTFLFIWNANTQKYGINSLNFRASVLWDNLPIKLKECKFLQEFKQLLKQSGKLPCSCLASKA